MHRDAFVGLLPGLFEKLATEKPADSGSQGDHVGPDNSACVLLPSRFLGRQLLEQPGAGDKGIAGRMKAMPNDSPSRRWLALAATDVERGLTAISHFS